MEGARHTGGMNTGGPDDAGEALGMGGPGPEDA